MNALLVKPSSDRHGSTAPTLQVIATKAGVSRETVSHILGGKLAERYKASTRKKVRAIAEELHYRPHRGAQTLKSGRSNLIAIVHFGAGIEAARQTNLALSRLVNEVGLDYLAIDMNWYGGSVERTLEELNRARVEGVLISHIQEAFHDVHLTSLREARIPVVSVNGGLRPELPLICDNVAEAYAGLTRHLLDLGHRRIIQLIAETKFPPDRSRSTTERTNGFRRAIRQRGTWVTMSEDEYFQKEIRLPRTGQSGIRGITVQQDYQLYARMENPVYQFCSRLFQQKILPDAIVCLNDRSAMEAIAAGLEYGKSVPDDIAVTGYDNDRIGEFPAFGITTAAQNIEGICSASVKMLMELIANPDQEVSNRMFESRLIIRTSCGQSHHPLKPKETFV